MLKRVLQLLFLIAVTALCYWIIKWVLELLGIPVPHQVIICGLVVLALGGAIGIVSGKADNINWWS